MGSEMCIRDRLYRPKNRPISVGRPSFVGTPESDGLYVKAMPWPYVTCGSRFGTPIAMHAALHNSVSRSVEMTKFKTSLRHAGVAAILVEKDAI